MNIMDLKYISATESDRDFFIHVHHISYRSTIEVMFGWEEYLQDDFANKAFDEGGLYIVWQGEQKVGVYGLEERNNYIWLKELFLLPEFQGHGIGSHIVQETLNQGRIANKKVRLQTLKANLRAKQLYERYGFQVVEVTDIYWRMEWSPE